MAGDEGTDDEPGDTGPDQVGPEAADPDPTDPNRIDPDLIDPAQFDELLFGHPLSAADANAITNAHDDDADAHDDAAPAPAGAAAPPASSRRGRRRGRVSKWDRPPEPHDWRWLVGGVGRVLVSVGILMFAFVAYQLWGTGIQEARAQQRLEDQFNEMLAAATTLPPATTTATTVPTTEPAPESTDGGSDTSSTTSTSTTTTLAPPAVLQRPAEGDPVALLELPSIDIQKTIVEGVGTDALRDGPGHFPETPFPGQLGNAAIAGHRTTYGHPFLDLDDVEIGDDVVVTTLAGRYVYVVSATLVVAPSDYATVVPTTDPTLATLTLLTCNPAYSTAQRLVVVATLDPTRSSLVTLPTPADGIEPTTELPGEDTEATEATEATAAPATETTLATADTVTAGTTRATDDVTSTEPAPTTTAAAASATSTTVPEDSATAFSAGWFDDPDAWPQVALWGLALSVIALGAYALSRKVRRDWVGALVGIGPFVVVLYFWFENVNRLLPPGL